MICGNVNIASPVNRLANHNIGRVAWWLCLPGLTGGSRLFDIMNPGPLGQHGTLTAMEFSDWNAVQPRRGGFGSITLDGSAEYVRVPDSRAVDLTGPEATWWAWVKPLTGASGVNKQVMWHQGLTAYQFNLSTTNAAQLTLGGGATTVLTGSTILSAGAWVSIGATMRNGQGSIYVNGKLENGASGFATSFGNSAADLGIGANILAAPSALFGGELDDLSIWSRALSEGEMGALHAASLGGYVNELNWIRPRRRFSLDTGQPMHLRQSQMLQGVRRWGRAA